MSDFLIKAADQSDLISIVKFDTLQNGLRFPIIKISNPEQAEKDKLKILFIAQQHGNEPSGKEALLLFIQEINEHKYDDILNCLEIIIIPQANPFGGDHNSRRNAKGIDLNRDHLMLQSEEAVKIQNMFHSFKPHMVVDIHEYYPYGETWQEFGYIRNFDIQLGGPTNININPEIRNFFKNVALPFIGNEMSTSGFTFCEYTLGSFPENERLRHSTVDINDGRQSTGITNVLSFIIEGKNGKDSIENIQRRTESQLSVIIGLVKLASEHRERILRMVSSAQDDLIQSKEKRNVAIRMDHFPDGTVLEYPLKSIKTGIDSVFMSQNYHPEVRSILSVKSPKAYLIPVNDDKLIEWLKKSNFKYFDYLYNNADTISQYEILRTYKHTDEELENWNADVSKMIIEKLDNEYYFVPVNQIYMYKIITALEPQAMYGLVNYSEFEYLLKNKYFPILRVE